jgi:preprotein translocase subunit SecF
MILAFEKPTSEQQVREALAQTFRGGDAIVQSYGERSQNQIMVRVPTVLAESGTALSETKQAVVAALTKSNVGGFSVVGTEIVSPTVGQELKSKGFWATVLSLVGILLYLAFRFQLSFAVGAVIATIHDLLVTLAFLAFFRYDLSLTVIAAILTMTGYSTNDTIVIFDRIRENLRSMRRDSLNDVVNTSINQTLGRTVITSGTALLTALALFFFGGEVLHGFAFTMVIGIITGTYSSVFVAAAVVTFWRGKGPARAAAHAPAPAAPEQQRRSKPQRKARAS